MKDKRKIIIILTVGFIMGLSLSGIGTYAATNYAISANKIEYSDNSNLGATNVQAAIDGTCTKFSNQLVNLKKEVINEMYPVGSIYITASISTASELEKTIGIGTWETYGQGRTLVGVGTGTDNNKVSKTFKVNETGGEYSHSLTTKEIPSHSHTIPSLSGTAASTGSGYSLNHTCETRTTSESGSHNHRINIGVNQPGFNWDIPAKYLYLVWGTGVNYTSIAMNNQNASAWNTRDSGAHTHTYPDCYLSSLSGVAAHTHTVSTTASTTGAVGGGESHNNIQPYIAVYMYKRTK